MVKYEHHDVSTSFLQLVLHLEKNFLEGQIMTLSTHLYNIAQTEGVTREQLIAEFNERIEGHIEEKILRKCLTQAKLGNIFIDFGRNILPPKVLLEEGFYLQLDGSDFNLYFG